jgi:hypothetical protein
MGSVRRHLSYANVISTIALFLVLTGGAALAASQLAKNSVGPKQLRKSSVTSEKVKDHSLKAVDLEPGVVPGAVPGAVGSATVTVVKTVAPSLPPNEFTRGSVFCPPGMQAVGGGVDPDGVFYGKVSSSGPLIEGHLAHENADGQHGPAGGWGASITTQGAPVGTSAIKIAVICSPLG